MEKQKLYDLLVAKGYAERARNLKYNYESAEEYLNDDPEVISLIPGIVDELQPKEVKAPHGLSEEQTTEYFSDKFGKVDEQALKNYEESEKKYDAKLEEGRRKADEYKRAHDDSYFNVPFVPNEYAQKQYVKGNTGKAVANDIAAKLAFASDFAPFPWSLTGPVVRTAQIGLNEGPSGLYDNLGSIGFDFGSSLLGPAKGAAKTGFESIKKLSGNAMGKLFDTKLAKNVEKGLESIDAENAAKLFADKSKKLTETLGENTVEDFALKHTPEEMLLKYDEIKDISPGAADELYSLAKDPEKLKNLQINKAWLEKTGNDIQWPSQTKLIIETNPEMLAREFMENGRIIDGATEFTDSFDPNLFKSIKSPATKTQKAIGTVAKAASKPALKAATTNAYSNNYSTKDVDDDYDKALDYIIDQNKRFWNMPGKKFVPKPVEGDILYEAWKKWQSEQK